MMEQTKNKKKRKLTLNKAGLILLVVVVAASIYVWKVGADGKAQIAGINDAIDLKQQQMQAIPEPANDLISRLEEVEAELAATREVFPDTVEHNTVIDYLLKVAEDCGVQILPLTSEGWTVRNIGLSYNVLSITATAEGSLANIKLFMNAIQNGRYQSLAISDLVIQRTGDMAMSAAENEIQVTANMRIGIYTLPLAPERGSAS